MSKSGKLIQILLLACAGALSCVPAQAAQYIEATITIDPLKRSAAVQGTWGSGTAPRRNLSFLRSAPGAPDLGSRISEVSLSTSGGHSVGHRKFDSAEYVGDYVFTSFRYEVDLKPPGNDRAAAHTSWLNNGHGLIYLDDILPLPGSGSNAAVVSVRLPTGWRRQGGSVPDAAGPEKIEDVGRVVWVIGNNLSEARAEDSRSRISIVSTGQWLFSQKEFGAMAAEIYTAYERSISKREGGPALITLLPFPRIDAEKGVWEAETRGDSVVIVSSDTHFKGQSLQRLHEQLRHEIFHLWLPNGVKLTGRYDWFYEGFGLYQSLRTGVELNRIRFEDMIDTLSRAHNIERLQARRLSLIAASNERWSGAETPVYARGMLVAFICDLLLLQKSRDKKGVEDVLRQLFTAHRNGSGGAADGNTAILKLLADDARLSPIVNDYIVGDKPIDLLPFIDAAGLEMDPATSQSRLRIKSKLNGRQKALLDKLGYNNWRSLAR